MGPTQDGSSLGFFRPPAASGTRLPRLSGTDEQLVQDPLSLFDGNVFFPYPRSLAFSEHLFVPSLLAAPWLAVSNNPVLAHNAVSLISCVFRGIVNADSSRR